MTGRLRLHIETWGCRVNQYDTDAMRLRLADEYTFTDIDPDIVILNACTVTSLAERKARQAARRLRRVHPHALVVLVGCLADAVRLGTTHFTDADLLVGNSCKPAIAQLIQQARRGARGVLPPCSMRSLAEERSAGSGSRIRAFLKIQDGCGRACTYCRTTQVRGAPRSKPLQAIVDEAAELVRLGYPEIVLTGIDLAQYAQRDTALADAVLAVGSLPGLRRLRLGSVNPSGITPQLLEACRSLPVVGPHFHVPLQSGDDGVLAAMQRGYDVDEYMRTIEHLRSAIPWATVGTDLIVGFPGEDEDAFRRTCTLVERVEYSNVHIFRFSPRAGTPAACFAHPVSSRDASARSEILRCVWKETLSRTLDNRIGSTQDLLVEEYREAAWRGYTHDYVSVRLTSDRPIPIGVVVPVHITGRSGAVLEGVDDHRVESC